jgi:hypothetical protein
MDPFRSNTYSTHVLSPSFRCGTDLIEFAVVEQIRLHDDVTAPHAQYCLKQAHAATFAARARVHHTRLQSSTVPFVGCAKGGFPLAGDLSKVV